MNPVVLYFASGESLYLGVALLLLAIFVSPFLKRACWFRLRNVFVWLALAMIVMACPLFPMIGDLILLAAFVLWFIASNRAGATPTQTWMRLQRGSTVVLVMLLLVLAAIEFSHRTMPVITGKASDHLVVIGDSISSGIDPRVHPWPLVLQQMSGVPVRNIARSGAQSSEGLNRLESLSGHLRNGTVALNRAHRGRAGPVGSHHACRYLGSGYRKSKSIHSRGT